MWDGGSPTFFTLVTVPRVHSLLLQGPAWLLRGTKVLLEQTSPWCCTASQEEQHRGGLAEPEEPGREAPPKTCCPPFPLTSLTCSTLCSVLAKIPPGCPWGLLILPGDRKGGGSWAAGSPPQPDTTSPPPKTATGTSAACRLPRDMSWKVSPKISLWG